VGNGLYTLRVANSGRMLDVKGGSSKSGANVQQYASNGTLAQHWYLIAATNGGYELRSAKSGLALDVAGRNKASGTNVQVYNANGTDAQRFYLDETQLVSNGTHGIAWSLCKPLVLDVSGGSKAAGANVQIYIANGSAAQQFVFTKQSDGTYTIKNKQSGLYLQVKDASKANGANVEQGKGTQGKAAYWRIVIAPQGGLSFQNVNSGKYLEIAGEALRLSTNVRQGSTNATICQNFVTVAAGYNPKIAKIGWQNPAGLPQVSRYSVVLPSYAKGTHTYVSPSAIRVDATREECIEAFISRAYDYLGTSFNEPWSTEPGGVGVDCSGLVLQCLYATGMDLEHAAGTNKVGGYNPYNHYYVPRQTYNSARWYESGTFKRVSKSSMKRGDLIFYGYHGDNGPVVYHVAIYLGNGKIIHSTNYAGSGNKVRIDNMYVSLYQTIIGVERPFV
jgi:cell wall-associated NlpC family hydrolase